MATTVQAILQQHYAAFAASHPLAPYQQAAAEALRDCRTAALGGHWLSCPNGHVHTAHFNSCHHRSCPQCATLARDQWLAGWQQRLLDCPHNHTIFTTPQDLVPLWRYNKRLFVGLLFHAATDGLRELLADPEVPGRLPGMLGGVHTWGQQAAVHVHLHLLLTWGGLTPDGRWVEPKKSCLLPRKVLMQMFRGKLRAYLLKALDDGRLVLPPDRTAAQVRGLLNRVGRIDWNVKILDRYEHGRGVVTYLARYLKGGPLSNGRLVDCRNGTVRFRYRDNQDPDETDGRGRRKVLPLPVDVFLQRLLEHVPPPNLQMVRPYGLYANNKQAERAVARSSSARSLKRRRRNSPGGTSACGSVSRRPRCARCAAPRWWSTGGFRPNDSGPRIGLYRRPRPRRWPSRHRPRWPDRRGPDPLLSSLPTPARRSPYAPPPSRHALTAPSRPVLAPPPSAPHRSSRRATPCRPLLAAFSCPPIRPIPAYPSCRYPGPIR